MRPTAYILFVVCSNLVYLVVSQINPTNHVPEVQIGHALGVIC